MTRRERILLPFVGFCLDHPVEMSLIAWLLLAIGAVSLYQSVT